jgi:hypothetical protein
MANLIVDSVNQSSISQKTQLSPSPKKKDEVEKTVSNSSKMVSIGVLSAGAVLLYSKLQKYATEKIELMTKKTDEYLTYSKKVCIDVFSGFSQTIRDFKKSKQIDAEPILEKIEKSKTPQSVVSSQDNGFEELAALRTPYSGGMQDSDKFRTELEKRRLVAWNILASERNSRQADFSVWAYIPPFKDGSNQKLLDKFNGILTEHKDKKIAEMNKYTDSELQYLSRTYFQEFANTIVEARNSKNKIKETILDKAFDKVKNLLNLEKDFAPSYLEHIELDDFTKLTAEELKPQVLPDSIVEKFDGNPYMQAVIEKDFSNISEEEFKDIFNHIGENVLLKDLRYLIDRFRLKNEVLKSQNQSDKTVFDVIIPKLKYLFVKLNNFGEKEIVNKVGKYFPEMNTEQKKSMLYYTNGISKKLGYTSLNMMDKKLLATNQDYARLNLNELMLEVKHNPDLYFFD